MTTLNNIQTPNFSQTLIGENGGVRFISRIYRTRTNGKIGYMWEVVDTKHDVPYREYGFSSYAGCREDRQNFLAKLETA